MQKNRENKFKYLKLSPDEWEQGKSAYYGRLFPIDRTGFDRIDYCLVVIYKEQVGGYVTCMELDADTVYWQLGGVNPDWQRTVQSNHGYTSLVEYFHDRYKSIRTRIENTNSPMLRMALKAGFVIMGMTQFNDKLYLELECGRKS